MITELIDYFRDRLDEEAEAASSSRSLLLFMGGLPDHIRKQALTAGTDEAATYAHYDRWGPKRVLAEVEAKRAVLREWEKLRDQARDSGDPVHAAAAVGAYAAVRALAQAYATRADFDPAWRA